MGNNGSGRFASGCGGGSLELEAGVLCVLGECERGCLCVCRVLLSLVPEWIGVRLSPRGEGIGCGSSVPVVPLLLVSVDTLGEAVVMLEMVGLESVDGACLDLERSVDTGVLTCRNGGLGGGGLGGAGGPGSVDIGVTILVDVEAMSEIVWAGVSSSSMGMGITLGGGGGRLRFGGSPPRYGTSGMIRRIVLVLSSSVPNSLIQL